MAQPDDSSLLLPFPTDTPEFRRGVEIGVLWATLQIRGHVEEPVHWDTACMMGVIADEKGLRFSAKPVDETWVTVSVSRGAARG